MLETILVKRKKISRETYRDSNMDLCHEQLRVARFVPVHVRAASTYEQRFRHVLQMIREWELVPRTPNRARLALSTIVVVVSLLERNPPSAAVVAHLRPSEEVWVSLYILSTKCCSYCILI